MSAKQSICTFLAKILGIYLWVIFARCILSWFPIDWMVQPFSPIGLLTDPLMIQIRGFLPQVPGWDYSPLIIFFVVRTIEGFLYDAARTP